jgi:hypothetical protein
VGSSVSRFFDYTQACCIAGGVSDGAERRISVSICTQPTKVSAIVNYLLISGFGKASHREGSEVYTPSAAEKDGQRNEMVCTPYLIDHMYSYVYHDQAPPKRHPAQESGMAGARRQMPRVGRGRG